MLTYNKKMGGWSVPLFHVILFFLGINYLLNYTMCLFVTIMSQYKFVKNSQNLSLEKHKTLLR